MLICITILYNRPRVIAVRDISNSTGVKLSNSILVVQQHATKNKLQSRCVIKRTSSSNTVFIHIAFK